MIKNGNIEYYEKNNNSALSRCGFVPCIKINVKRLGKTLQWRDIEDGLEGVCLPKEAQYKIDTLERKTEVKKGEILGQYTLRYYDYNRGWSEAVQQIRAPYDGIVVWTSEKGEEIVTPNGTKVCHVKILPTDGL